MDPIKAQFCKSDVWISAIVQPWFLRLFNQNRNLNVVLQRPILFDLAARGVDVAHDVVSERIWRT